MSRFLNRLEATERLNEESRRWHVMWADLDDTQADLDAKRDRVIAEGRASPDDKFIYIGWLDPQKRDTEDAS